MTFPWKKSQRSAVQYRVAEQIAAQNAMIMSSFGAGKTTDWSAGPSLSTSFQGIKPVCAVCRRYVNRFTDSYDQARRQHVFKFECHGREEVVGIDQGSLYNTAPEYVVKWLSSYEPFKADAERMRQAQIVTDQNGRPVAMAFMKSGAPVTFVGPGQIIPTPPGGRPDAIVPFMQKIIDDIANNLGVPVEQLNAPLDPAPAPKPKPKPEDFLIPARKPRIITLED